MKAVNTFLQHFKHFSSLFFTKISRDFTIFFIKWISTHTSLVGCDLGIPCLSPSVWISTHTSLVGCDYLLGNADRYIYNFYSHIPCGMWQEDTRSHTALMEFLLTHPLWDVTDTTASYATEQKFLLTHPLWDVTATALNHLSRRVKFLLTHPLWDVTQTRKTVAFCIPISTHTSLVGCDAYGDEVTTWNQDFYSHIPCGMWHLTLPLPVLWVWISTHTSLVGCDVTPPCLPEWRKISTHTSLVGCDRFISPFSHTL